MRQIATPTKEQIMKKVNKPISKREAMNKLEFQAGNIVCWRVNYKSLADHDGEIFYASYEDASAKQLEIQRLGGEATVQPVIIFGEL
jgi:hypothetical protein